jgi:preprotein translocase subunit SecY
VERSLSVSFALGIMPYISASIVVQLMGIAIPYLQKTSK